MKSSLTPYLEAIYTTAIDTIVTINERGIVESFNPAGENLFGYQAAEVVGQNVSLLMPEPYRAEHDGYINRYLATHQPRIIGIGREVEGLHKSGVRFPIRLAVSETVVEGRRIFVGIIHDLSDVKKAEAKIKKLNEELESKVKDRTEELAEAVNRLLATNHQLAEEIRERTAVDDALRVREAELRIALDKEKELNQLKSRFVSMASHEFRTPLSAILSSADLLEAYTTTEQQEKRGKHIARIKAAVTNLTGILNDFLSLSKLEEDKVLAQPVWFDIRAFCSEISEEMKSLFKPGQHIVHRHSLETESVFLDKKILKSILYNLLSNAIKYSNPSKPIHCGIQVRNHWLTIEIADEGIGIPEEDQHHLFTRFFRAHNAENIPGTGLGLNIVRRYLDLLGGDIRFSSQEGVGTTFTVKIQLP